MSLLLPENRLLATLPQADFDRLAALMTDVTFGHKDVLYRAGGAIDAVYFPRSGALSAVVGMADGAAVEVGFIGREGVTGMAAAFGATRSHEQVFCQLAPCACRTMPAGAFAAEVAAGGPLRDAVCGYLRGVLTAAAQMTACNALHPADARCARWLLMCRDRAGADAFPLTHEVLATMLGVRRATVTEQAGLLQKAGIIAYKHGVVTVLERGRLAAAACECYAVIRDDPAPPPRPSRAGTVARSDAGSLFARAFVSHP